MIGRRLGGSIAPQVADKADDRQNRNDDAFDDHPEPIPLDQRKGSLHSAQGNPWPEADGNEKGLIDRHIVIKELLYVLQHGSAEPRSDMRSVAVDCKYHESPVAEK